MSIFKFSLRQLFLKNEKHELCIEGINFEVGRSHNAIALIGESGMGKTTIFKSLFPKYIELWSLESQLRFSAKHSFNKIDFTDEDIKNNNLPLKIGFANQLPYFLENNTVEENIFSPLKWTDAKKLSPNQQCEYLERWNLSDLAQKHLSILSGGQRQIINIARAMVLKPDVMIIDEGFSSMNEKLAKSYINLLKSNYPDVRFIVTSHRHSDIDEFGCPAFTLKKEQSRAGYMTVTLEG